MKMKMKKLLPVILLCTIVNMTLIPLANATSLYIGKNNGDIDLLDINTGTTTTQYWHTGAVVESLALDSFNNYLYIGKNNGDIDFLDINTGTTTTQYWHTGAVVKSLALAEPVPVPATVLLFGTGLAILAGSRIRRKKSSPSSRQGHKKKA